MPQQILYTLGSYRRWLESWMLLVAPFLAAYFLLCMVLHHMGIPFVYDMSIALLLMISCWGALLGQALNSTDKNWHVPWLSDITRNLAHGSAEEDGIHFRKWFRRRFVTWRAIARVEYWPDYAGRIDLYLYSQLSPVVFIPESPGGKRLTAAVDGGPATADYICRKLEQTWPGRSTFLICYEKREETKRTFIDRYFSNLNATQKALANALFMLLTLLAFYGYLSILTVYYQHFWKAVAVNCVLLLLIWAWVWLRFSRKSRIGAAENAGTANALAKIQGEKSDSSTSGPSGHRSRAQKNEGRP